VSLRSREAGAAISWGHPEIFKILDSYPMIIILFYPDYFYYLAFNIKDQKLVVTHYISEKYLFVVAHNVGFLKRFAGL
jgi:hypothetical protein